MKHEVNANHIKLTPSQERALSFISDSIRKNASPTLREICQHMGFSAIGSAQDVVAALRKKGYLLEPSRQAARALRLSAKAISFLQTPAFDDESVFRVPVLGQVPAGHPLEAIEQESEFLSVSRSILPFPSVKENVLFALKAQGSSMINAGILDGDWLVVRSQPEADVGEIVVARQYDDATVKRLMHDPERGLYLKPENPRFQNIYGDQEPFELIGRVVALQRRF